MLANLLGAFNLKRFTKFLLVSSLSLSTVNCGSNLLSELANREDDASLYQAALMAINDADYDTAVTACTNMSASYLADEGKFVCASAYAGRCGYTMTSVVSDLGTYDPSTDPVKVLEFFMTKYPGSTTAEMADCSTAVTMLRASGIATARTDDENFFLILMGLSHLGVVMNTIFDTDDDDVPEYATLDPCLVGDMSNAQASEVGMAFWEMYRSAEAMSSSLTTDLVTALDAMSTGISAVGVQYNFLLNTADPTAFTPNELRGIRTLIKEGQVAGLGYACDDFVTCLCP